MESIESAPGAGGPAAPGEEERRPPVHYSTGRLTRRQAETVNRWRARLAKDKPLPGQERVPPGLRALGIDNRPKASCSDAIAAAAAELLAAGPDPMAVARYADASWQAQRAAAAGSRDSAAAPVYPPVSWYLPTGLADTWEELRYQARATAAQARNDVITEAEQRYPADGPDGQPSPECERHRRRWYLDQLRERNIPLRGAQIPRGVLARMAIDAWARHTPDEVCAAAVDHAAEWHEQPHRGRRDMHQLQR
jgi:hypothetical protein